MSMISLQQAETLDYFRYHLLPQASSFMLHAVTE